MTERELRKLNRFELLEMLIGQIRENEALQLELEEANEKLARRAELVGESGNIAEAALQLNGVFEAAQAAADHYLDSVRAANPMPASEAEAPVEAPAETEAPVEVPTETEAPVKVPTETEAPVEVMAETEELDEIAEVDEIADGPARTLEDVDAQGEALA